MRTILINLKWICALTLTMYCSSAFTNDKEISSEINTLKNNVEINSRNINSSENKLQQLNNEIISLKTEIKLFEKRQNDQINYYETTIYSLKWIASLIAMLISGTFAGIIWFFSRPGDLLKRISLAKNKVELLIKNLDKQHQHQKVLFLFKDKGSYNYSNEDWQLIKDFAKKSRSEKPKERNSYDWYFIGLDHYKNKNFKEAIDSFENAIILNKKFERAFKDLGNSYFADGNIDKAIENYKEILKLNPNSNMAYNNLGVAYTKKQEYEKALCHYKRSLKIEPNEGFIYINILELDLISKGDFDPEIVEKINSQFRDNKQVYATYKMFELLSRIVKGDDVDLILSDWEKKHYVLGGNKDYQALEEWANSKEEPLKSQIIKALDSFKKME
ncbi:tetratricopeptide repeat protein [Labilibacter sediminis]|nr:tetratricopeptide repeat protein [Labilibacter sediminis]